MVGKLAITVVFSFDYFWSSEVFPTTLRATLVGLCSLFARIGVILSPIIVDLVISFSLIIPTIHVKANSCIKNAKQSLLLMFTYICSTYMYRLCSGLTWGLSYLAQLCWWEQF